jgi:hypothetical protein
LEFEPEAALARIGRLEQSLRVLRHEDFIEGRANLDAIGESFGLKLHAEVGRSARVGGSTYQTLITRPSARASTR